MESHITICNLHSHIDRLNQKLLQMWMFFIRFKYLQRNSIRSVRQATYSEGEVQYTKMPSQKSTAQMLLLVYLSPKNINRGSQAHAHMNILKIDKVSKVPKLTNIVVLHTVFQKTSIFIFSLSVGKIYKAYEKNSFFIL